MMWNHPDCYGPYGGSSSNYLSALRGKIVAKVAAEMPEEGKEVESPRDVTPNDVGVKNVVLIMELTEQGTSKGIDERE